MSEEFVLSDNRLLFPWLSWGIYNQIGPRGVIQGNHYPTLHYPFCYLVAGMRGIVRGVIYSNRTKGGHKGGSLHYTTLPL